MLTYFDKNKIKTLELRIIVLKLIITQLFLFSEFLGNHNYLYCSDAMIPCQVKVIGKN